MGVIRGGGHSICEGFHVQFVRVMKVRVDGLFVFGGENNTVVVCGVNVVYRVKGGFHVSCGGAMCVRSEERVASCHVRTSDIRQPPNATNQPLTRLRPSLLGGSLLFGRVASFDGINGAA